MNLRPYKRIRELEEHVQSLQDQFNAQLKLYEELENDYNELYEQLQETPKVETTDETSCITYYVDHDLNVKPETKINPDIQNTLLNNDFIQDNQLDDQTALHIAMILISNEVSTQLIRNYEKQASKG